MRKTVRLFILITVFFSTFSAYAAKRIEMVSGSLKLTVFPKTGRFCLYHLSAKGKNRYIPLFDDNSNGTTNKFSVYFNGKVYDLDKKIGRPVKVEQQDGCIIITFKLNRVLYVSQRLSFTSNTYGTSGCLLKVDTIIENTSGAPADIGLKAVFDTWLGEKRNNPLYTDTRTNIYNEIILEPKLEKDSVIVSANSDVACLFLIKEPGATLPDSIYAANWDNLNSRFWHPPFVEGRSFSTKYLHNDSALLFVWEPKKKASAAITEISMYLGHYDYIRSIEEEEETANMSVTQKLNYDRVKSLLKKIAEVEANPDGVSNEALIKLKNQVDNIINENLEE